MKILALLAITGLWSLGSTSGLIPGQDVATSVEEAPVVQASASAEENEMTPILRELGGSTDDACCANLDGCPCPCPLFPNARCPYAHWCQCELGQIPSCTICTPA